MESSSKSQLELGLGCKSLELSLEHGRPEAGSAEHTVPRAQSREGSAKALEERSLTIPFLALGFPSLQGQFQTCLLQNPSSEIAGTMTTRSKQLLLLPLTGAGVGPAQHLAHRHFGSALLWVILLSTGDWSSNPGDQSGTRTGLARCSQLASHCSGLPTMAHVFLLPLRAAWSAPPRVIHSWGPARRSLEPLLALSASLHWTNSYASLNKQSRSSPPRSLPRSLQGCHCPLPDRGGASRWLDLCLGLK